MCVYCVMQFATRSDPIKSDHISGCCVNCVLAKTCRCNNIYIYNIIICTRSACIPSNRIGLCVCHPHDI